MKTSIKVEAYGSAGYRAVVVQPSGVPPMVGSVADTMAEAVRCMCVVLGHRGDFVPLNTAYPDGSRGHVPSKIDVIWIEA